MSSEQNQDNTSQVSVEIRNSGVYDIKTIVIRMSHGEVEEIQVLPIDEKSRSVMDVLLALRIAQEWVRTSLVSMLISEAGTDSPGTTGPDAEPRGGE